MSRTIPKQTFITFVRLADHMFMDIPAFVTMDKEATTLFQTVTVGHVAAVAKFHTDLTYNAPRTLKFGNTIPDSLLRQLC